MKLQYVSLAEVRRNPRLYSRLKSLTLKGSSNMRDILNSSVRKDKEGFKNCCILVARKQNSIVGWCMTFSEYGVTRRQRMTYFFTAPKMRRMGIGSALLQKRKADLRKRKLRMHVISWDKRSGAFFRANRMNK